jgi:copper chaperone CopZ
MESLSVKIDGMNCQHCVKRVQQYLSSLDGIYNLNVKVGEATLDYDKNKISPEQIKQTIVKSGYKIA